MLCMLCEYIFTTKKKITDLSTAVTDENGNHR